MKWPQLVWRHVYANMIVSRAEGMQRCVQLGILHLPALFRETYSGIPVSRGLH